MQPVPFTCVGELFVAVSPSTNHSQSHRSLLRSINFVGGKEDVLLDIRKLYVCENNVS